MHQCATEAFESMGIPKLDESGKKSLLGRAQMIFAVGVGRAGVLRLIQKPNGTSIVAPAGWATTGLFWWL